MFTWHKWGVRPIVTLINEFTHVEVQWHDVPNTETFRKTGIFNDLQIQVEMKAKRPYGGTAWYKIWIDSRPDSDWRNVHTEEIWLSPERGDKSWNTEYRNFSIRMKRGALVETHLPFRVTVSIEEGGSLPTGSGGSSGHWSEPQSREFTAILPPMSLDVRRKYVVAIKEWSNDGNEYYADRFRIR